MADATKVQMGVCSVTLDGNDIGHTKGGVEIAYEPVLKDVTVDLYGETPVEKKLIGEKLTAKIPFAEYTIANLNKAMPHTTLAGAGNARATVGSQSGKSAIAKAVQLVIHPIAAGASRAYDVVMYKAYQSGKIALHHKIDEEKIVMVEYQALIDETKSDGNYLGLFGDSAA